jgi:hypothetical protein
VKPQLDIAESLAGRAKRGFDSRFARGLVYIGLMSGTSLDGVDAVLRIDPSTGPACQVLAHVHRPFEQRCATNCWR